jgi:hypothetical protein
MADSNSHGRNGMLSRLSLVLNVPGATGQRSRRNWLNSHLVEPAYAPWGAVALQAPRVRLSRAR